VAIEVRPSRVPDRGPSPRGALVAAEFVLLAVFTFAQLGRHPTPSAPHATLPPLAVATASPIASAAAPTTTPSATVPLAPDFAPAGRLTLAAVTATELWASSYAGWPDGLWHYLDGAWSQVPVAELPRSTGIVGLAAGPGGTLAVATDLGVAGLRGGRWSVLTDEATVMALDPDGVLWLVQPTASGPGTVVSSFRFDGERWVRRDLPVAPVLGASSLVVDGHGDVWLGEGGLYAGAGLVHFDGTRWTSLPLKGSEPPSVYALALAPNGDLWASIVLNNSPGWSWSVARHDKAGWALFPIPKDPGPQAVPPGWWQPTLPGSSLAFAPDGALLVTTRGGLRRLDGTRWTSLIDVETGRPLQIDALSSAPDGAVWGWGASGIVRIPEAAAP